MSKSKSKAKLKQEEAQRAEEARQRELELKAREEELLKVKEQHDLEEFRGAARINLSLRSSFGLNDNLQINGEVLSGTMFEFCATWPASSSPAANSKDSMVGDMNEEDGAQIDPRIIYPVGRRLAMRTLGSNKVTMLPIETQGSQISALTAKYDGERCLIAFAESDTQEPTKSFVSIYDISEEGQAKPQKLRIPVPLTTISDEQQSVSDTLSPKQGGEEVKEGGRKCAYDHGTKAQTFTGASGGTQRNKTSTIGSQLGGGGTTTQGTTQQVKVRSMVTKLAFSANFDTIAVLVNGQENFLLAFAWRSRQKPIFIQRFPVYESTLDSADQRRNNSDVKRRDSQLRSLGNQDSTIMSNVNFTQSVNQLSFSPINITQLVLSGPMGTLQAYKLTSNAIVQETSIDEMLKMMDGGSDLEITDVCWTDDGSYLAAVSSAGHVVIKKMGYEDIQVEFIDGKHLVSVRFLPYGLVTVSKDGSFYFFEIDTEQNDYFLYRNWNFKSDMIKKHEMNSHLGVNSNEDPDSLETEDVIRGFKLQNEIIVVQLCNRNLLTIDAYTEVYSPDKKADIQRKLKEHDDVVESAEEQVRLNSMSIADQKKAVETRKNERAKILEIEYQIVGNRFHSAAITEMHTCLQRPILLSMSYDDQTLKVWNYETNTCDLTEDFTSISGQKSLVSCALHPSGYYLAAATTDQISVYHLLYNQIRKFHHYELKNVKKIRFSQGGQYLIVFDNKYILIFSTYTLERIQQMQIPSQMGSDFSLNFNDQRLIFSSSDGMLQNYDLLDYQKLGETQINKAYKYSTAKFLSTKDPNNNQIIAVGSQKDVGGALVLLKDEDFEQQLTFEDSIQGSSEDSETLCLTDVCLVVSAEKMVSNLIVSTNRGSIKVLGLPPRFLRNDARFQISETFVHSDGDTLLRASECGRFVFSAGADGNIFVFDVCEVQGATSKQNRRGTVGKQSNASGIDVNSVAANMVNSAADFTASGMGEPTTSADLASQMQASISKASAMQHVQMQSAKGIEIQEELGRIVLVSKQVMKEWRAAQEHLRNEMVEQSTQVETSLRQEKVSHMQRRNVLENEMTQRLNELNKSYEELQMQEAEEKDANQQAIHKMENQHTLCKEELQELYERKLVFEQEQFRKLKQEQLTMEKMYMDEIETLNKQHDQAVNILLQDFKSNLQTVQQCYEDSKAKGDGLKYKNEAKLDSQGKDQTYEIDQIKQSNSEVVQNLDKNLNELKNSIEIIRWKKNDLKQETEKYIRQTDQLGNVTEKLELQCREYDIQIKELNKAKKEAKQNLKRKDQELYKQKFKIKHLQKYKQVFMHKTQEMKASLEPKEQQIETLKQNLSDLEKVFEMQANSLDLMQGNVKAKKSNIENLEKKLTRAKVATKRNEQKISCFVLDIQKAMQQTEDIEKIDGMKRLFLKYVKDHAEEVFEKKRKDPETINELDKHLKYMEKSIRKLKEDTARDLKKSKSHIRGRTKENKDLIEALDILRENDQKRKMDKREVDKHINEIDQNMGRIRKDIAKMEEEMIKLRQQEKLMGSQKGQQTQPNQIYNARPKSGSDEMMADNYRRSQSKGKLIKGPLRKIVPTGIYKQQIKELLAQLDDASKTILLQNLQITTLRDEFEAAQQDANQQASQPFNMNEANVVHGQPSFNNQNSQPPIPHKVNNNNDMSDMQVMLGQGQGQGQGQTNDQQQIMNGNEPAQNPATGQLYLVQSSHLQQQQNGDPAISQMAQQLQDTQIESQDRQQQMMQNQNEDVDMDQDEDVDQDLMEDDEERREQEMLQQQDERHHHQNNDEANFVNDTDQNQ